MKKSVDSLIDYAQSMYEAYGDPKDQFVMVADKAAGSLTRLTDNRFSLDSLATQVAATAIPTGDGE